MFELLLQRRCNLTTTLLFIYREDILKNAKALVEDTRTLVPAAQASQDTLANAAQSAVASVTKLSDRVKLGAAALGADDTNAQVGISGYKCLNGMCKGLRVQMFLRGHVRV